MNIKTSVPFLALQTIETRSSKALSWVRPNVLKTPSLTPIAEIAMKLAVSHNVQFQFDQDLGSSNRGKKILGMCQFRPRIIYVDKSVDQNGPRFRFTLAHELGHLALHRNLWLDPVELDMPWNQVRDDRSHVFGPRQKIRTARDRLEWQANAFAASLLMPRQTLIKALIDVQQGLGIRRCGTVFVDSQPANLVDYEKIVKDLVATFGVSRTALSIRLKDLGILDDQRDSALVHITRLFRVA